MPPGWAGWAKANGPKGEDCKLAGQNGLKRTDPKVRIVSWFSGWAGWAKVNGAKGEDC